ncbi:polymer-forming cytoskeletal protein [Dyella sp.]|jgi:cytoskeletal protein CcmA (bactofilin family)|uniref:bactofilin family protein n=1 Tax=Dyella sp. TaxID=1869338 RepID=UPI002D77CD0F|nr:polymer-forming cytoskeletal protein [Dyella sp.]HET6431440.1 polymer-forming cytoskeletal protein [Dyella sp.]
MLNRKRATRDARCHETSLIARGTIVRGDVQFTGALHLDGCIQGAVIAEAEDAVLTVSEQGQVIGEIRVPHAVINGRVDGNVLSDARLELAAQACINGDVHYCLLEMAAGAQVNGRMVHAGAEMSRGLASHKALEGSTQAASETPESASA